VSLHELIKQTTILVCMTAIVLTSLITQHTPASTTFIVLFILYVLGTHLPKDLRR
jgi:hypothetical protein